MIYFYLLLTLTVLCSLAVSVLAVLSWRNHDDSTSAYYYPLALLAVLLVASFVPVPVAVSYKAAIVLGLLLILVATLLRVALHTPPVVDYAFEFIAVALFMAAFASQHPIKWPTPWVLVPLIFGGLFYWFLLPRLAELAVSIAVYAFAFFLLLWQALELLVTRSSLWSWLAFGAVAGLLLVKVLVAINYYYTTAEPAARRITAAQGFRFPIWGARVGGLAVVARRLMRVQSNCEVPSIV
ncbi:MAG: lysoplasmalogenase family protein [Caldilineaceae bacterium]